MTRAEQAFAFLRKELRSFIDDAVRPPKPAQVAPDEGKLIERASEGAAVRGFLESAQVQDFLARAEANLTTALIGLPLDDNDGRRNLAVAIQTQRQLVRYLTELARDGRAAEAELQRMQSGPKAYF